MMSCYAYLFETRSIQGFLFATGKLKDMLSGSELIDFICAKDGYVDYVLGVLDLSQKVQKPRQAGGAFYLIFENETDARRFQHIWRLLSSQWLPSIERVDALSVGDTAKEAISRGIKQLAATRNQIQVELPVATPITQRSPRTGLAAVGTEHHAGGRESIDAATNVIRHFKRPNGSESLTDRFLKQKQDFHWPNNFEADAKEDRRFPLGKRSLVGLIHADGNGLGEILRLLADACKNADDRTYIRLYQTFSEGVTTATIEAARQATEAILVPQAQHNVIPARPLVLGGDDLSVIIRADLAVEYTQCFLKAFKQTSQVQMAKLKEAFNASHLNEDAKKLPDFLTACAGIAFMKASQPFYSAYALAESLCSQAKKYSRQFKTENGQKLSIIPSSLAFYKINQSIMDDVDSLYEQTQIAYHGEQQYHLSSRAYLVGEQDLQRAKITHLEDLLQLERFMQNSTLNDRALREIATLIHVNLAQAKQSYSRWKSYANQQQQDTPEQSRDIVKFEQQLKNILGSLTEDLPFSQVNGTEHFNSIIGDLLTLFTIADEQYAKKAVQVVEKKA